MHNLRRQRPLTIVYLPSRSKQRQSIFRRLAAKIQRFFPSAVPAQRRRRRRRTHRPTQSLQPIHRLGPDLLSKIFITAVHYSPADATNDYVPFALAAVSRLWRAVALHSPALWRRIPLVVSQNMALQEHALLLRLARSRGCGLGLDVYLRGYRVVKLWGWIRTVPQRLERENVWRAMRIVVPEIHRWRSFLVESTAYGDVELVSCALGWWCEADAFPSPTRRPPIRVLEEMKLVFRANAEPMRVWGFEAPRLRRLVLEGVRFAWGANGVFARLTFLDYRHHPFSAETHATVELMDALRCCPALRELRVLFPFRKSGCLPSDAPPAPLSFLIPLTHRTLAALQLVVDGPDIPREMLLLMRSLHMPVLQSLTLLDLGHHTQPFYSLRSFRRICPCITRLAHVYAEHGWTMIR